MENIEELNNYNLHAVQEKIPNVQEIQGLLETLLMSESNNKYILPKNIDAKAKILRTLYENGPEERGELARILDISRTSVYENIEPLVKEGIVKKVPIQTGKRGAPRRVYLPMKFTELEKLAKEKNVEIAHIGKYNSGVAQEIPNIQELKVAIRELLNLRDIAFCEKTLGSRAKILEILYKEGPATLDEIKDILDVPKLKIYNDVRRLVKSGIIIQKILKNSAMRTPKNIYCPMKFNELEKLIGKKPRAPEGFFL